MDDGIRIGVYVCHCGTNIAHTVDVEAVAKFAKSLPHVVVSRTSKFTCSQPGQERIQKDIAKPGVNRVVVAACSPQMHELTFRRALQQAGLNPYLLQIANIREHCSWIHDDRAAATRKAMALVAAAVRRVALHQPLEVGTAPMNPATMVVGGGVAGIQAVLELAEAGHAVHLVERDSTIGGAMAKFDKTFPTLDCAACILAPKMVAVTHRPNIRLHTLTDVTGVQGAFGDFAVTLRHRARYVSDACTACGACTKVCPVSVPSPFDEFLGERTAIHRAFAQAIPTTHVIEKQERPPCIEACPIRQEAAGYVALVRQRKFKEAARLIRMRNPLANVCGRVCHHPCERECNRALVDAPVAVRSLKRFVLDWARAHGVEVKPPRIAPRDGKVAVIGSGPAGLTAAYDLARAGWQVTVFERDAVPGGILATGIPAFRLPRPLLEEEIGYIERMGVSIRTGVAIGTDVTLDDLRREGYRAFFLATGRAEAERLGVPGDTLPGVLPAVQYLRQANLGQDGRLGAHVVVIGGGDVAMDAARTALRLGAKVRVVFARSRMEMTAHPDAVAEAVAEGVSLQCLRAPVRIVGEGGRVSALRCVALTLDEPDEQGRRGPVPIEGTELDLPCDAVLVATGPLRPIGDLAASADPQTKQTPVPDVFAVGPAPAGPPTVVAAMSHGRRAAEAIDRFLQGQPLTGFRTPLGEGRPRTARSRPHSYAPLYRDIPKAPRVSAQPRPADERRNDFADVAPALTEEQAVAEASRCLACGVCVECLECERVCEPKAVTHAMTDTTETVPVGQVLLATGYQLFDAKVAKQYGYGRLPDVYHGLEFERLLNSAGPTGGRLRCRDGRTPRAIALLHCIGSRDDNYHRYCSRVCCMYALKFAHLVKDRTDAEVYQCYLDMRAYGKGFEEFYGRVLEEGVHVIRGKAAEVEGARGALAEQGTLVVRCEDTLVGRFREIPVDMVVLCTALEPQADADKVKKLFSISMSPDGFFLERHPKLDPVATFTDGVYIAGCCQGPKDIPDTVAQASAAAARMMANIARGQVTLDPVRAEIDPTRCSGCRICNSLCPYLAIGWDAERRVSAVNTALCKGCGTCVAACPASAITGTGFTDEQVLAELEGLLTPV
jgi:heterodisulfide reductase subunit A